MITASLDKRAVLDELAFVGVALKITFDGLEPGLKEHRLSLSSFGKPLTLLLAALRRTASGIRAQAADDPAYGQRGGRLAMEASLLDLELERLEEGSLSATFCCVVRAPAIPPGGQLSMPQVAQDDALAEKAVHTLLRNIDAERAGKSQSPAVRRYLAALPSSITKQRYTATHNGTLLHQVEFETAALTQTAAPLPRLIRIAAQVTSVGFEPGASFVGLKTSDARTLLCNAAPPLVEKAIGLRGMAIVAAVLEGKKPTLVWIRRADEAVEPPSVEETAQYAHAEWGRTLEALSK